MPRKIILWWMIVLLCLVGTPAMAEIVLPQIPGAAEDAAEPEIYLQWPAVQRPPFPTVTAEEEKVTLSGLAAYGVLREQMLVYHYSKYVGPYALAENNPGYLDDQIVLNLSYEDLTAAHGVNVLSFDFRIGETEGEARFFLDPHTPGIREVQMIYNDCRCAFTAGGFTLMYDRWSAAAGYGEDGEADDGEGWWSVTAGYGEDGRLVSAHVYLTDASYTYERLSSVSYRYGLTYVFPAGNVAWHDGVWYDRQTGEAAQAVAGIDLENPPFTVVGDAAPEESGPANAQAGFPAVSDPNAVYALLPADVPPMPQVTEETAASGACRVIVRDMADWGLTPENQKVWQYIEDQWTMTEEAAGEDTLILEAPQEEWIDFSLRGNDGNFRRLSLSYSSQDDYIGISLRTADGSTEYERNVYQNDSVRMCYRTEADASVEAVYNGHNELREYSVEVPLEGDVPLRYTYTYEPFRGARADRPVLMFVEFFHDDAYDRYYWQESRGWSLWNDAENAWNDADAPDHLDLCVPLPLK